MNELLIGAVALGDEIERFGSYFGYAAIVGLGVLALLYFSQAREVKRLREWAGRAPERDAELAQRVQADAQRRAVPPPVSQPPAPATALPGSPQTVAAQQADAARRAAAAAVMQKFQPAGGGTPPAVGPPGQLARPVTGAVPPPAAAAPSGAGGTAPAAQGAPAPGAGSPASAADGTDAGASGSAAHEASAPTATPPSPASSPAAAASGSAPAQRSPAFANGAGGQDTHESAAARPSPLPALPPRPPRGAPSPPALAGENDGSGGRVGLIVGGSAAVLAIGIALMLVLTPGGDQPPADNAIRDSAPPPAASPTAPSSATKVDRAATQIAVLNGTVQTGLARAVGNKLQDSGFTILSVGDNADQQIATTKVSFAEGSEAAARVVARIVGVNGTAVQPIDTNTATAVAPEAKVVVVVGNDRSSTG